MTRGPKKCQMVRRGAPREENFGEVGKLRVWGCCMESGVRRCVFIEPLLFCPFELVAH